jgi:predicted mannosyl-3-phosphoglycerate phosphatase (HAD superfamily)
MSAQPLTVRHSQCVDIDNLSLRRGFLDMNTPLSRISELQMPLTEQREFLRQIVKEAEEERARLYEALGRPNKGNFTHYTNKKPHRRMKIRAGKSQAARDADRYLQLGQKIQEAQRMMRELKYSGEQS